MFAYIDFTFHLNYQTRATMSKLALVISNNFVYIWNSETSFLDKCDDNHSDISVIIWKQTCNSNMVKN
jgi:hypothetical protein